MVVAADVLSSVLAFVFFGAGSGKLTHARQQVATADRLRVSWDRYRLVAVPELLAAIGLIAGFAFAPVGVAAAIGLALLMIGAFSLRVRVRDSAGFLLGDSAIFGLAVAAAIVRALAA